MNRVNQLWPRLSHTLALLELQQWSDAEVPPPPARSHPQQTFAATGGRRVTEQEIAALAEKMEAVAVAHGYGDAQRPSNLIEFDRNAATVLFGEMNITTFEATQRGMWTFLSVVAMPSLTDWRFGTTNLERWVASDLTRHMFSRLWWQAYTFGIPADGGRDYRLLHALTESDLNQLTERRSIGGNPRLARAVVEELLPISSNRRNVVRTLALRLRRVIPFIDFSVVDDDELRRMVRALRVGEEL